MGDTPSLSLLLAELAHDAPGATAIAGLGRPGLTYAGLFSLLGSAASALRSFGIGRNDRVAVVLPNGPEMASAFLAVASCATCAPLNPAFRSSEFDFTLSDLRAKALIVPAGEDSPAVEAARARAIPIIGLSVPPDAPAGVFTLQGTAATPGVGGAAEPADVALILHTSGTTSRPKVVPLTQSNICASACNIRASLALTSDDRCLNVMPLFHIHGLIAAVLATLSAGGSVVCPPGFDAARFFGWLEEFRPTWFTAVPTMHQAILARAASTGGPVPRGRLRFIRSCSSSLAPRLMAEIEEAFGVPVIEAYGMTEASHQMTSNPLPPRPRKPGSVGIAAGPEVAIMDEAGRLSEAGSVGEIVIRGANVTPGYENNPAANAGSFTAGWFRTGDQGRMDEEGYVTLTGRLKEIINRGGEKISPREVDEVIMDHPAVAQAVAFGVPHPALGEDIAAAVVLRPGAVAAEDDIRRFAAERLSAHKLPRRLLILPEIPKGPTGKPQRIGLYERLAAQLQTRFVPPRDEIEARLAVHWAELLETDRVGAEDDFFMLGGSSIVAAELFARLSTDFGVELAPDTILLHPTVAGLADVIRNRPDGGEEKEDWPAVVAVRTQGSQPAFVMASLDLTWDVRGLSRYLGPDYPVYGLRPTRRFAEENPGVGAESAAAFFVEELRAVRPRGPYVVAGGCAAGIVAYEMARQLRAAGESVPLLVLFDVDFPLPRIIPYPFSLAYLRLPRWLHRLSRQPGPDQRAYIRWRARTLKTRVLNTLLPGRPESPDPEPDLGSHSPLRKSFEIFSKRQRDAIWRYAPAPYPGRIAILRAKETGVWFHHDRRLDWRRVASGGCMIRTVPGEHNNALKEPHVKCAAEQIKACLAAGGGG